MGMIELAVHRVPGQEGLLVQPRTLVRTTNIERGIVQITARPSCSIPTLTTSKRSATQDKPQADKQCP
jgi:hypothetical protein